MQTALPDPALERRARRRAAARLGWLVHAIVFVAVNALLFLLAQVHGTGRWVVFPTAGWAVGLAVHGLVVWLVTGGAGLYDRLLEGERRRLAAGQDPW